MKTFITTLILASMLILPADTFASEVTGTVSAVIEAPAVTTTTTTGGNPGGGGPSGGSGTPTIRKGDANKDGRVDILDFVLVMAQWNRPGTLQSADFNLDNKVDILDFVILMANWTK